MAHRGGRIGTKIGTSIWTNEIGTSQQRRSACPPVEAELERKLERLDQSEAEITKLEQANREDWHIPLCRQNWNEHWNVWTNQKLRTRNWIKPTEKIGMSPLREELERKLERLDQSEAEITKLEQATEKIGMAHRGGRIGTNIGTSGPTKS